jgi:hypothetical protein
MVMEELGAGDSQVKEALADTLDVVQEMTQAGPPAVPRVTVHTRAVRGTTSRRARAMVDRPMVIIDPREMGEVVFIREELCPCFPLGSDEGCDGRGAPMLQPCQRNWRSWRVLVGLGAALPPAEKGWTARLGGGATAQLPPAWSGCAGATCDGTGQPFAARPLGALLRCHVVRELAGGVQMVRLGDAPSQHSATTLRGPFLDVSGGGHVGGVPLQGPQAQHQSPCEGTPRALRAARTGPSRAHGTLRAQADSAVQTVEALQSVVAPVTRLHRIAATAWTRAASGPAHWSHIISGFLVLWQVRYQVLQRVAPRGCEQPHDTDTA